MTMTWTILCIFLAVSSLAGVIFSAFYDFYFSYRFVIAQRLHNLRAPPTTLPSELLYQNAPTQQEDIQGPSWRQRLDDLRLQADTSLSCFKLNVIIVLVGLAVSAGAFGLLRNWWSAAVGLLCGAILPIGYLHYKRRKRLNAIVSQLPKAIEAIRRAILSGQSTPLAFQLVADEFPDPIAAEFRYCFEQQNLGVSYEACLRQLTKRIDIIELRILAIVLLVQCRTGGSMAKVLENMANIVRKRLRLKQRIRALTSEGRMQALILTVLPFMAFGALLILAPDYLAPLLKQLPILYCALLAQLLGILWMRQLVNSES